MPIPLILGAAAAAAPAIFNLVTGIGQKNKAKRALDQYNQLQGERPQYSTPEEAYRILSMSQQAYADPNIPGQSVALDRNTQSMNNVIAASSQAGNPFAALVGAQAANNASNQDIFTQATAYKDQQRQQLFGALQTLGQYKDMEFQMNEFAPWADKTQMALNQYRDYRQAGNNNVKSGLEGIGGIGMALMGGPMGIGNPTTPDQSQLQSIYQSYAAPAPSTYKPPY